MYRDYFKLRERPFTQAPGQRFFAANPGVTDAVTRLRHLPTARDAIAVITGGPGVGKSAIVEQAMASAGEGFVVARVDMRFAEPDELFPLLLLSLGEDPGEASASASADAVRRLMSRHGKQGQRIVVSFDSIGLTTELARQLLRLVNLAGEHDCQLNVILQGPHTLHQQVDLPALIQLRQRISYRYRVRPLTLAETDRYIRHQIESAGGDTALNMTGSVAAAVYCYVAGVPRLINTLMDAALTDACLAKIDQPDGSVIKRTAEQLGWKPLAPKQAEGAAPPASRPATAKTDAGSQTSRLRAIRPATPPPASSPGRLAPIPMSALAARTSAAPAADATRPEPRRAEAAAKPLVAMDATDTGATGMLRLQDLDERFAESIFSKSAEETAPREQGIDRS